MFNFPFEFISLHELTSHGCCLIVQTFEISWFQYVFFPFNIMGCCFTYLFQFFEFYFVAYWFSQRNTQGLFEKGIYPHSLTIIYTKDVNDWDSHHLSQCGWYLDCPNLKTSFEERLFKEQFDIGLMLEEVVGDVVVVPKVASKNKSFIIGETFAQNIHTKKIKCKFGFLHGQSSSTLKDDNIFQILEHSNYHKKDGTKFDPKFRGEHNASIHVPSTLPPSLLLTSTRPKVSLKPPHFKFKMLECFLNASFTSMVDTKMKIGEWLPTLDEMKQFIEEACNLFTFQHNIFYWL